MTQRKLALQGTLVLGLIVGTVGGNFVLHRWMLGDATSRAVDAGTRSANSSSDDLEEFRPASRSSTQSIDSATHRERLQWLIAQKLPHSSATEREDWLEELSDLALPVAEGILDLRSELEKMKSKDVNESLRDSVRVTE